MSRTTARDGIEVGLRMRLAEADLDVNDVDHTELRRKINDVESRLLVKLEAGFQKCAADAEQTRKYLIGILCSVVVAALMLAANILILGGPG